MIIMKQQHQATVGIREMILRGELAPGQRVLEDAIARQLGLSRTPVRQALPALAEEGLLVAAGRRGYAVRIFSISEIVSSLDIRAMLEGMAARLLTERGVPTALMRTLNHCLAEGDAIFAKGRFDEGDEILYGSMNENFHNVIIEAADNSIISDLIRRLHRIPFISPTVIAFDQKSRAEMFNLLYQAHQQHHAIVDALEHRQGSRAEHLFREHVYSQKKSMNLSEYRPDMQRAVLPRSGETNLGTFPGAYPGSWSSGKRSQF
jgi:GntR family transcriptional regulator of vanillate catabolism